MQQRNIPIALPYINQAKFGFSPDEKNNQIIYGLKAINGIGDDVVRLLLENRPYKNIEDFYERMVCTKLIKNSQMLQLIKAGAFNEFGISREDVMQDFIKTFLVNECKSLGMQQFNRLVELDNQYHFIPENLKLAIRHVNFKSYVLDDAFFYKKVIIKGKKIPKSGYHDRLYELNEESMSFFLEYYSEDSVEEVKGTYYVISEKKFKKENLRNIEPLKQWLGKQETLDLYNYYMTQSAIEEYASGTVSKWEMDALSVYATSKHELYNMDETKYGVENYFDMPEEPDVYSYYNKKIRVKDGDVYRTEYKEVPKYVITRIAGTVLDKNKDKHFISLLTKYGVVSIKFNKGRFANYNQQISKIQDDGKKKVLEKSWFERGNKLIICGYRQGDIFRAYKYADTVYKHSCMLIKEIKDNGDILASLERYKDE